MHAWDALSIDKYSAQIIRVSDALKFLNTQGLWDERAAASLTDSVSTLGPWDALTHPWGGISPKAMRIFSLTPTSARSPSLARKATTDDATPHEEILMAHFRRPVSAGGVESVVCGPG